MTSRAIAARIAGAGVAFAIAVSSVVCAGAATRASPAAAVGAWREVTLPIAGTGAARPAVATFDGTTWWIAGSIVDGNGAHRPGVWRSPDAAAWTQIETVPLTGYGEVSELFTLAATPRGLVAVGAATGGAHGNPRTVSWVLAGDGRLHEVAASFELYNGPRQITVRTIAAAPGDGWVIFGTRVNRNGAIGATSWTSADGTDFEIHDDDSALSSGPSEYVQGFDVVRLPNGSLLAVGERGHKVPGAIETDAIAWRSDDGVHWQRWTPPGAAFGGTGAQRAQRVAADGSTVLIAGSETRAQTSFVAWTSRNDRWTRTRIAALGTSDDPLSAVTTVLATPTRSYVAARVGTTLRLAASSDGRTWTKVELPPDAPAGTRAQLGLAAHDDIVVSVARSESGGRAWVRSPLP